MIEIQPKTPNPDVTIFPPLDWPGKICSYDEAMVAIRCREEKIEERNSVILDFLHSHSSTTCRYAKCPTCTKALDLLHGGRS